MDTPQTAVNPNMTGIIPGATTRIEFTFMSVLPKFQRVREKILQEVRGEISASSISALATQVSSPIGLVDVVATIGAFTVP